MWISIGKMRAFPRNRLCIVVPESISTGQPSAARHVRISSKFIARSLREPPPPREPPTPPEGAAHRVNPRDLDVA